MKKVFCQFFTIICQFLFVILKKNWQKQFKITNVGKKVTYEKKIVFSGKKIVFGEKKIDSDRVFDSETTAHRGGGLSVIRHQFCANSQSNPVF